MTETPSPRPEEARVEDASFHVHWDRTSLFLVGVVALAVAVVTALSALAGRPTAGLAGWSLMITCGSVVGLRLLAGRDERRHDDAATVEAEVAADELDTAEIPVVADPERDRRTLDAALSLEDAPAAASAPAVGEAPTVARRVNRVPLGGIVVPEVPRPTYLDAPVAERPLPEEHRPEETPRSTARLKDPLPAAPAQRDEQDDTLSAAAEREIAALDLDGVLARRRAS